MLDLVDRSLETRNKHLEVRRCSGLCNVLQIWPRQPIENRPLKGEHGAQFRRTPAQGHHAAEQGFAGRASESLLIELVDQQLDARDFLEEGFQMQVEQ